MDQWVMHLLSIANNLSLNPRIHYKNLRVVVVYAYNSSTGEVKARGLANITEVKINVIVTRLKSIMKI